MFGSSARVPEAGALGDRQNELRDLAEPIARDTALTAAFARFDSTIRAPLRRWAAGALADVKARTVFYPFGGPDLCVARDLFPHAGEYVLVGREPVDFDAGAPLADPAQVASALRHYLDWSYFITRDLASALAAAGHGSLLSLLVAQIVHSGLVPHAVTAIGANGLSVEFLDGGQLRRVSYYRQDLRDEHWSELEPLQRHLARSGPVATLLKCASYLPHEPYLGRLRDAIRTHSSLLVQDPSGIPHAELGDWGWDVDLHGRFTADIPTFRRYDQSRLAQAYTAARPALLGFPFGYLTDPATAALMIARPGAR